jgi:drug/metabolite transporter (DMT)-like permease
MTSSEDQSLRIIQLQRTRRATVGYSESRVGVVLIMGSAVAFSTAGFFTHLVVLDIWTVLFWRGIFGGLFIASYVAWQHRTQTLNAVQAIGRPGILAVSCTALSTICFVAALHHTTVADVNVIYATAPFIAAGLQWVWTRERESRITLLASVVALLGVGLTVDGAVVEGHLFGDLLAFAMTVLVSTMMVIIRINRTIPMLPAAAISALSSAVLVFPLADPWAASGSDMLDLFLFGTTQFGFGLLLLTLGTRLISATRSALWGAAEIPLACVWVWLAFNETPSAMACLGSLVVMASVSADILLKRSE